MPASGARGNQAATPGVLKDASWGKGLPSARSARANPTQDSKQSMDLWLWQVPLRELCADASLKA